MTVDWGARFKELVGIKRRYLSLDADVHEAATEIARCYLTARIESEGGNAIGRPEMNARPSRGPDLRIRYRDASGRRRTCRAEVSCNFSYAQGPEADSLYDDVQKLLASGADTKVLVVVSKTLVEDAKNRCRRRRNRDPIDLDKSGVEVLSVEDMIESRPGRREHKSNCAT